LRARRPTTRHRRASAKGICRRQTSLPLVLTISAPLAQPLRYGENPHQTAALYGKFHEFFKQLHGKELSYNNILDLTAAANLIAEFSDDPPTLAILKHTNPCGVGQGANLREAWDKAFATDKQAPFGGIIAVNQPLDGACAAAIAEIFSEVIVAPEFSAEALAILQKKKNLRLLQILKCRCPRSRGTCAAWARIRFCCSSAI
jgi:phosphoribosylaminoimidazolecarboxamide formyltransferase/IMP cyclohydrolase